MTGDTHDSNILKSANADWADYLKRPAILNICSLFNQP